MKRLSLITLALVAIQMHAMEGDRHPIDPGQELIKAARTGDLEKAKSLITIQAHLSSDLRFIPEGKEALLEGVLHNSPAICELLIQSGQAPHYYHLANAVLKGHKEICQLILKAGVDLNYPKHNEWRGLTVLEECAQYNEQEIAELIVEAMLADPKPKMYTLFNCLKRNFDRGTYYNLCNIFQHQLGTLLKHENNEYLKNRARTLKAINKLKWHEIKKHLLQKYFDQ